MKKTKKWSYLIVIGFIFGAFLTFSLGGIFLSSVVVVSCLLIRWFSKEEDRKFLTYLFISGITARIIIYCIYGYFSILSGKGAWLIGDAYGNYCYAWLFEQKIDSTTDFMEGKFEFLVEDRDGKVFYANDLFLNWHKGNREKMINGISYGGYGFSGLTIFLGYLFYIFEPLKFSGRLINILFSTLNGIFVYYITKDSFDQKTAKISSILATFFPSLIIWSLDFTKEPVFILMTTVMLWSCLRFLNSNNLLYLALICIAALIQSTIREYFWLIGLAVFIPALFLFFRISLKKKALCFVMTAIAAVFFINQGGNFTPDRASTVVRANILKCLGVHVGSVNTGGFCYRTLEDKYYLPVSHPTQNMTTNEILNAFVMAWTHFLLEPYVWDLQSKSMILVTPQIIVWYLLLILAILGVVVGFRYNWKFTLTTLSYVFLISSIIALSSANIGTLFRHRDMVTTLYLIFSAVGISHLLRKKEAWQGFCDKTC